MTRTVYNITIGSEQQPGVLTVLNGQISIQLADGTWLIKDGIVQGIQGTKVYYVADSSGGATSRQLTFRNGLLVSEA